MATTLLSFNGVTFKDIAQRTWAEVRTDDVFGRSAQLAYYFLLALFPFLICVIASLSVVGSADSGRALLFELLERFLPDPAFQLISQAFDGIMRSSGHKMSFGIIASLWSASLGVGAMMDTLNAAYNVKETRSLIKQYSVAVGLTCGISLLIVTSLVFLIFGGTITAEHASNAFAAFAWSIVRWLLALVAALLALAATYFFAPNLPNPTWRRITPGSITAVSLLMLISIGLKAYIHYWATYNQTYGSLGAVIVLLLFFYLSGVAVLSGGVLNAVLERAAKASSSEP